MGKKMMKRRQKKMGEKKFSFPAEREKDSAAILLNQFFQSPYFFFKVGYRAFLLHKFASFQNFLRVKVPWLMSVYFPKGFENLFSEGKCLAFSAPADLDSILPVFEFFFFSRTRTLNFLCANKIKPSNHLKTYRDFIFMPKKNLWQALNLIPYYALQFN